MADLLERMSQKMKEIQQNVDTQVNLAVGIGFLITIIVIVHYVHKRYRRKAGVPTEPPNLRFRKRDKMIFYGKKMLRKVKELSQPREEGYRKKIKKRQKIMFNFAKQLLRFDDNEPERKLKEPPRAFLEADITEADINDLRLPPDVVYMLKSVRVFGHFEKPLSFELCRYIETKFVPANTLLFRPGQADDNIYVVQSGKLSVCLVEKDGTEMPMKVVTTGDSIYSVLSMLDVLSGRQVGIPQISCRALTDTHVLKLPGKAFQTVFEQYPDSLVRVVQIIMLRLQQVTFMALHNFLGLSYELIATGGSLSRQPSVSHAAATSKSGHKVSSSSVSSLLKKAGKVSQEISNSNNATASPDSAVIPKMNSDDKVQSHPDAGGPPVLKSEAVPIPDKKALRRCVSFTEPEHQATSAAAAEQLLSRNRSMIQMSTLWNPDSDEGLVSHTPSDFLAACGRARVVGIPESPSHKASFDIGTRSDQSEPEGSPVSLDAHFDFPGAPAAEVISKQFLLMDSDEEDKMLKEAVTEITSSLELPNESYLDNMLTLASIPVGTAIIEQGDLDCNLFYVLKGTVDVLQKSSDSEQDLVLFTANAGEFLGGLSVVTGEPSFFTCKATKLCHVAIITKPNFYSIMHQWPRVVLNVAHSLVKHLSPFLRQIDYALDWMHVEAGRAVYRQGEQSHCIYIVLNGRLRSVVTLSDGKKELVNESGRGELVGVVEVLTQSPRATTVHAIRDTELALLPEGLLNTIKRHFPQVVSHLIRVLGERLLGHYSRGNSRTQTLSETPRPVDSNLGTVALIPASDSVPLSNFSFELSLALNCIGPTLLLTSSFIRSKLGPTALDSMNEYRLSSWLGQQEDIHRIVLYQADSFMSAWTKRCIRQADYILIVAVADESPVVNQLETQLENTQVRSQKELVLLHRAENPAPITHTVDWLNARGWISSHYHVRCSKKIFSRRLLADRFARRIDDYPLPARNSDFARLARRLTGTSIGLVLGGGGARGLSHVGVIKALEEGGIPIDMVGGTSMGSFVGAALAITGDVTKMCEKVHDWSWDMTSIFKKLVDLTYPFTSIFSGSGFNAGIRSSLGERQIEDLLLPYFCITTDITSSRMRIHTDGSLWRYVRASMSLSGYLPPLCDPKDGHLLLDGGYVNNLPADVMRNMGAQTIIAVDVGSEYSAEMTNYGDDLSGWWLLWNKWNPFAETVKVPDMAEIQSRLAYVSCVQQLEEVRESSYCEYVRPPIERFKTLDFGKFEEIMDVGYHHAKTVFKSWIQGGRPPDILKENISRKQSQMGFTDLAERISRIDQPILSSHFDWEPSSYVDGAFDSSAPESRHLYLLSEDEDDDRPIRYRPRTGSLSEHEDLLALKAQARAIQQMEERNTPLSGDEAGYDSDDTHLRRRMGQLIRTTSDP